MDARRQYKCTNRNNYGCCCRFDGAHFLRISRPTVDRLQTYYISMIVLLLCIMSLRARIYMYVGMRVGSMCEELNRNLCTLYTHNMVIMNRN